MTASDVLEQKKEMTNSTSAGSWTAAIPAAATFLKER